MRRLPVRELKGVQQLRPLQLNSYEVKTPILPDSNVWQLYPDWIFYANIDIWEMNKSDNYISTGDNYFLT